MSLFCVEIAMQILTQLKNKKRIDIATDALAISTIAYQHNQYIEALMAGLHPLHHEVP